MSDDRDAVWMAFDESGNAFDVIDYTPEALEAKARDMRRFRGELTTVTMEPSPFARLSISADSQPEEPTT